MTAVTGVAIRIPERSEEKENGFPQRQKKLVPLYFRLRRKLRYTPSFFLTPNEPAALSFVGDPDLSF